MRPLLDNQINAIERLSKYKVGALFMEAGTGKTQAACELVNSVDNIDYVLWIAPFGAIHSTNYQESIPAEVAKCGGVRCRIEFIGIESIQSSDRIYLELRHKVVSNNTFIVCDESIKIKNFKAKRTRRLIDLATLCDYRLILNGTPLSRDILDLWAQFEFLSPKILKMDFNEYKNTFCEWVKITKTLGVRRKVDEFIKDYHNIDYLYSLISPYVYECELDLNVDSHDKQISYFLSKEDKAEYNYVKNKYLDNEKLQFLNNNIFLEMTQKMQHSYSTTEDKFEKTREILKDLDRSKVIIACKFISAQEAVKKEFPEVEVLSFGKHIFGLNKQEYNHTIFWDKTFDYMQLVQLKRRTYRTGQQNDCYFYHLTGDVGLEEMIDKNISKKKSILEYFKTVGNAQIKKEL